ncbi:MAG: hypothetical protein WCN88_01315 [Candidatus Falkowbacteria bacterium]
MLKKNIFKIIAVIAIAVLAYFVLQTKPAINEAVVVPGINNDNLFNVKTCEYLIDKNISSNSQYFGNDVKADFNKDGLEDDALIIIQNSEGSGVFYYIVAALRSETGCIGTNAILLGDRIAPQNTEYVNGEIVVNYADRRVSEAMTVTPSIGVSRYFKVENGKLIEIIKEAAKTPNNYKNSEYGFELNLPDSWLGYSIVTENWNGQLLIEPNTKYQGPKILIRNPKWSAKAHWQDIPVLVFTPAEWKLIQEENLGISAAPIGPSKLGENSAYIFALPPRWLGFTDDLGQDEAAEIVKTFKAYGIK